MKVEAKVRSVHRETHDVKTFRLYPEKKIDFTPGQYCLVSILDSKKHKNISKPFTYSSSPTKRYVELTVKRMGNFTTAIHNLKKGDRLLLDGPRGNSLNFDETVKEDVVFIAGGSGITPFMSSLRYAVENDLKNNITLLFSNRTKKDIIFEEELETINNKNGFNVVNTLSDDWSKDWGGETGMINSEMIKKYIDKPPRKVWYICGPPPMIDSMVDILNELGVNEEKVKYESWMIPGKGKNSN